MIKFGELLESLKFDLRIALDKSEKNCLKCMKFDEEKELCKEFNARPPARVIVSACEKYLNIEGDIPF